MTTKIIRILHLSDLHYSDKNKDIITRRLKSLFNSLESQKGKIDLVVFTGDVTQSGKANEFDQANNIFFEHIKSRLNISKSKIYIAPGNHDVDRDLIDHSKEELLSVSIKDTKQAEQYLNEQDDRILNFDNFISQYFKNTKVCIEVKGLILGLINLNSAWRCTGKNDYGNLYITEKQAFDRYKDIEECAVRIGLMHHPFDWLHKSEHETVINDLKRYYDLIFTGHLHKTKATNEITPACNGSLILSAPSIYNSDDRPLGYNIYELDYENKTLKSIFYKYVRGRDAFDRDTDQADGGEYTFNIYLSNESQFNRNVICQKLTESKSQTLLNIRNQLSVYQQIENPILVKQKLASVHWSQGKKSHKPFTDEYKNICLANSAIYAPKDMGKSIFMQNLVSSISELSSTASDIVAVYINLDSKPLTYKDLITVINNNMSHINLDLEYCNIVVGIDHPVQNDFTQLHIINELTNKHKNIKCVVNISNSIIFETLNKQEGFEYWSLYEILHWGPSTIKEYIDKYLTSHSVDIDIDAAFKFITNSLRDSDLPSNPVNITLYLSVIPILENKFSSLSFLHLLEKIEHIKLESTGGAPENSLYNKREVLSHLACLCLNDSDIRVEYNKAISYISDHFSNMALKVDVVKFLKELSKSGVIDIDYNYITFRHYIFFDYFLARAYEIGIISVDNDISDLQQYVCLGKSLALFCGMKRSYDQLIYKLIDKLDPHFDVVTNFTLSDLDSYIHSLLEPIDINVSADDIADQDMKEKVDYESLDQDYHNDKNEYASNRRNLSKVDAIKSDLGRIAQKVSALQVLYNCYRNLENITADNKMILLNQILEFHICCNLDMISYFTKNYPDKDYHTIIAYIATISGQEFLTEHIANQSLEVTFEAFYNKCDNDFKQLLIICLMADLKLDNYSEKLRCFAETTKSRAAIEIIYFKIRDLIINTESKKVPTNLISALKSVFNLRAKYQNVGDKKEVIDRMFNKELEQTRTEHLRNITEVN